MSEPLPPPPPAPVTPRGAGGFFQDLVDVYFSPREAFNPHRPEVRVRTALRGYLVLALGFTGL